MSRPPRSPGSAQHRLALLVTGASGMLLPRRVLATLARHPAVDRLHLVVSRGAAQVLRHELPEATPGAEGLVETADLDAGARAKISTHRDTELDAPIASGSYGLTGTIVLPCSAGTLGALATGSARTLIHRAGAVAIKEGWPFVLGFRETPYSIVHLENMRRLAYAGATILPPVPAFYVGRSDGRGTPGAEDFERFLDHYTLRVLDRLGIRETEGTELRWKEEPVTEEVPEP
jgi:4-hydroxy-3-polyprenylbenzoate decarboxylase